VTLLNPGVDPPLPDRRVVHSQRSSLRAAIDRRGRWSIPRLPQGTTWTPKRTIWQRDRPLISRASHCRPLDGGGEVAHYSGHGTKRVASASSLAAVPRSAEVAANPRACHRRVRRPADSLRKGPLAVLQGLCLMLRRNRPGEGVAGNPFVFWLWSMQAAQERVRVHQGLFRDPTSRRPQKVDVRPVMQRRTIIRPFKGFARSRRSSSRTPPNLLSGLRTVDGHACRTGSTATCWLPPRHLSAQAAASSKRRRDAAGRPEMQAPLRECHDNDRRPIDPAGRKQSRDSLQPHRQSRVLAVLRTGTPAIALRTRSNPIPSYLFNHASLGVGRADRAVKSIAHERSLRRHVVARSDAPTASKSRALRGGGATLHGPPCGARLRRSPGRADLGQRALNSTVDSPPSRAEVASPPRHGLDGRSVRSIPLGGDGRHPEGVPRLTEAALADSLRPFRHTPETTTTTSAATSARDSCPATNASAVDV